MSILRADSIRDRAGTGAPDFPNGLTGTLTGNVTGTASTATLANTATVATNAQGLTGTPNITVGTVGCGNVTSTGDVTGVNATFSGNLTVQGTTTTIDTAVTSVDSLAVDGNVTAGGILGLKGTPDSWVNDSSAAAIQLSGYGALHNYYNNVSLSFNAYQDSSSTSKYLTTDQAARYTLDSGGEHVWYTAPSGTIDTDITFVERLRITSGGTAIFKAGLAEKYNKGTTLAAASNNVALTSGNVHRFTSNESGAQTVNFTGVHSTLADGESVSFTVLVTPASAGYINAATVDGVAPGGGLKWSGGSAPSAGGASGRDVYTFTIFKDGTATDSYEIFGAVQNYA